MLNSTIAAPILNGLFAMGLSRDEDGLATSAAPSISFSTDLYLGLLTQMPSQNDGTGFREPTDDGNYKRIKLNTKSRINKKPFIAAATAGDRVLTDKGDYAVPACVENQGAILFPEAGISWEPIVGFGIFRSDNTNLTTAPMLWGEVTTPDGMTNVSVEQYEVPVIRAGGLKVSLM